MTSGTDSGWAAEFDAAPHEPIGALVAAETHARPAGLDRMAGRLAELLSPFGPIVRHPTGPGGANHLVLSVDGAAPAASAAPAAPAAPAASAAPDRPPYAAVLGH